jgi:hypothetical protein
MKGKPETTPNSSLFAISIEAADGFVRALAALLIDAEIIDQQKQYKAELLLLR